jgi:uncharacterized protein (TIGR02302 family)
VLGIGAAVLASGLLGQLPLLVRYAALGLFVVLLGWTLWPLFNQRRIKRVHAMRRLEENSSIRHRAVSSADDRVASEILDPRADALWEEHQRRQLAKLGDVKVTAPQSRWRLFDPLALRVPVAMALLAALLLGPGSLTQNMQDATRISPPVPPVPLTLDAWLKPPAYTGRPPLLLTSPQMQAKLETGDVIEVPENAVLSLRLSGGDQPKISFLSEDTATALTDVGEKITASEAALMAEATITRPMRIVITNKGKTLAQWPIVTIPDKSPTLELTEQPAGDGKGNLTLKWKATDDYGLKKLSGEVELSDEQDGGTGFESNGVFLFEPPEMKFVLKRAKAKEETGTSRFDLARHPWAGLQVTLNMTVADGAGNETSITPVTFKLPERAFVKPLPRALIEQRKELILFPERARHVGEMIDTLALYPKGLFEGSMPIVAMTMIGSRLRNAGGYDDVNLAIEALWDLAVKLEEGALSDLRAELQALKDELEKALREGAPPERIAELMDRLRKTMDKFMEAMREEAERRQANGEMPQDGQQSEGREVTREDLQKMMDALEEMSKQGNTDMAQQLLEELNRMLQNMQPGQGQQSADGQGQGEKMMQGLGNMMRKQQRLMDDTQRMGKGQGQEGEQGEGQQPGQQGEGGEEGKGRRGQGSTNEDLAERQRELRRMLEELRDGGGGNMPGALGDAGEAMEQAEEALRGGDREGALQKEGEALDNLRKGAQELAQQMRDQGQGREGAQARDGEGRSGEDDPLGRPRATRNPDEGPDEDIVPSERAMQRAREILEQLREKSNRQGLTDSEKAYIERLLRGQY